VQVVSSIVRRCIRGGTTKGLRAVPGRRALRIFQREPKVRSRRISAITVRSGEGLFTMYVVIRLVSLAAAL
jgi:DNA primase